jgi:iron complex outermembrane receptor protein
VGRFFDRRLRLELGLRAPFFKRELKQNCFTNQGGSSVTVGGVSVGGGFTLCAPIDLAQAQAISAGFIAPFEQDYKFDALLPNVGAVYNFGGGFSLFGSYARGFSAPRTDNLYRRTFVDIQPETTDAFDLGARYTTGRVQAQATAWLINYQNRIITSFDPELGISIDRNVGKVRSRGFDASIAWQPIEQVTLYTFGSYIQAEFQEDVQLGFTRAPGAGQTVPINTPILAPTRGKMVAETPKWQVGGRVQFEVGPAQLGVTAKWVDDRFATDVNDVIVPSYTLVDLDARFSLAGMGLETSFFQLNVINLFNERYFGNIGTQINAGNICPVGANCAGNSNNPTFTPGSPRTIVGTLNIGF